MNSKSSCVRSIAGRQEAPSRGVAVFTRGLKGGYALRVMLLLLIPLLSVARDIQPTILTIWPEGVPGLRADAGPEASVNGIVSGVHHPTLAVYQPAADHDTGTAVIICPGGGYVKLATAHEGEDIARWMNSLGVTAFVLRYRLVEYGHPAPLRDVLRAIRLVRSQASAYGISPDRIGIIGASAGGHLAACAVTLHAFPVGNPRGALDEVSARPDFAILMYPVITMKPPFTHVGSREALLGSEPSSELIELLSPDGRVTHDTPPCFIVHSGEDKVVPVENSLLFYQALRAQRVPAELHLLAEGRHGIGIKPGHGRFSQWPRECEEWLRSNGWLAPCP